MIHMGSKRLAQPTADAGQMYGKNLSFAAAEAYKLLRTNLLFAMPDEHACRIVGITSATSGEGKSTTALNLAYMLAETGRRTLLIEGDMRLPSVSRRLGLKTVPGLSNLLAGLCQAGEAVQASGIQAQLWVIPSGDIPPNPSELLGSKQMQELLGALSGSYDFIILDLPPVNAVADALVAAQMAHGVLMVVRQNYVTRQAVAEAMRQIQYIHAKLLGFVVTDADGPVKGGKKYGYRYGYGYGSGSSKHEKIAEYQP